MANLAREPTSSPSAAPGGRPTDGLSYWLAAPGPVPESALQGATTADGVIIGSALIDLASRAPDADAACAAVGGLLRSASAAIAAG